MKLINEFYKTFDIIKIEVEELSRTVDNNGKISEHYVNEFYPPIEPVFFDLLELLNEYNTFNYVLPTKPDRLKEELIKIYLYVYEQLDNEKRLEFKQKVQDIFEDYYSDR